MNVKINKLPKSEIEIEGEIDADVFEQFFNKALKKIGETLEIDGFRKGKAPESVLLAKIPEMQILEEAAELALQQEYPKIVEENKLDVITHPEISITKVARKNPLGFKIKTAILPETKLPDYKKIAKKILSGLTEADKNTEVTEEEINNTILDIRKSRATKKTMPEVAMEQASEDSNENREGASNSKSAEENLPEFNDAFVQSLGQFKDIADFTAKLKENMRLEKANQNREKTRLKIVEAIMDETKIDLPNILIDSEVMKIIYRMESDITAMGLSFADYLKHINKTEDDLKKDFRNDGEKKAKLSLILDKISKEEKIVADPIEVENEVNHILEHYKDADPKRARAHAENVLTNEKIFQFLEKVND